MISAHALTPDLPVFACMSAGIAGFYASQKYRASFALLAGCAALFRYSGCTVIPLLVLIGWRRQGWRGAAIALLSAVPIAALILRDLDAYGRIHLLAMFASQNDAQKKTIVDSAHNMIAGIAMLGAPQSCRFWCGAANLSSERSSEPPWGWTPRGFLD